LLTWLPAANIDIISISIAIAIAITIAIGAQQSSSNTIEWEIYCNET